MKSPPQERHTVVVRMKCCIKGRTSCRASHGPHPQAGDAGRREQVLQGASEGVEKDPLLRRLRQVVCQIAQQDSRVGADGRLLVNLHTVDCSVGASSERRLKPPAQQCAVLVELDVMLRLRQT